MHFCGFLTVFLAKNGGKNKKTKKIKKWSGDISKLHLHTEFQENRPIRLVSSDVHRHTHTHTDTHTHIRTDIFSKPLFWTQGTSKRIFPLKSQSRIFLPSQYFLHTYCIWEKVKYTLYVQLLKH